MGKRKFEMGRPPAITKLGSKRVRTVRGRGGNLKFRALRLDSGNYSWGSENFAKKVRILDVVYNASNNELVRTKTLVKGAIVQVDGQPFKQFYYKRYGVLLGQKKGSKKSEREEDESKKTKVSRHVTAKRAGRASQNKMDPAIDEQLASGRLLCRISSRPGQSGRCDGYVLEGDELTFYKKKLEKKKKA